jgi:hypothetical protein
MINEYVVRGAFKDAKAKGLALIVYMNDEGTDLFDSETNERVCSVKTYTQHLREKLHCDFEVVYYEHATLDEVLRCKQCGTVIFTGDDERYDPNLCCPGCGDYQTGLVYWTGEEIKQDEEKRKTIEMYEEFSRQQKIEYERRKRRGGLYDWQLIDKTKFFKKWAVHIELEDFGHPWDGEKNYRPWWKRVILLRFSFAKKNDNISYSTKWKFEIPLTPYRWYISYRIWKKRRKKDGTN